MSKEATYDASIAPLMAEVIRIAQSAGIATFITFHLGDDDEGPLYCTTSLADENGNYPELIKRCYNAAVKPMLSFLTTMVEEGDS